MSDMHDLLTNIDHGEHLLYKKHWRTGYRKSQCAVPFAKYIISMLGKSEKVLEIGSGDGTTIDAVRMYGFDIKGSDIYSTREDIEQFPANRIPYEDNSFDYVVSTDVMEHIPQEILDDSINECLRVAKKGNIHVIATFESARNGDVLHKTVKNIYWWKEKFSQLNKDNKTLVIIDRKNFI